MPKKRGKRGTSKVAAARNKTDEITKSEVEEPVKTRVTRSKTKKNNKSVDEDDNLYDQDISDDSDDESDLNLDEMPWAKKSTDQNLPVNTSNRLESSTSQKPTPSSNNASNTAVIPKKKRDLEEGVIEVTETTIPKKKREIEEDPTDNILTETIVLKTNESNAASDLINSTEPTANLAIPSGKTTSPTRLSASTSRELLQLPLADSKRPQPNSGDLSKGSSSYQIHVPDKASLPRSMHPTPNTETNAPPAPSIINEKTDQLQQDINRLIEIVYKDKDRSRTASLETVDMVRPVDSMSIILHILILSQHVSLPLFLSLQFGSFLSKESNDFYDRDDKGNIVVQAKIPIFPEDFAPGQKPFPLSWWGIISPPELIMKYHYPPPLPPPVQPPRDPMEGRFGDSGMHPPRDTIHDRRTGSIPYEPRQHERDRVGPPHGVRNYGDPIQGHSNPMAGPSNYAHPPPGWDHHSYPGGPPMNNRPGFRPGGAPDWQRNMRDDRWNRNPNMDRPHP
jgi:hypothetical protein